MRFLLLLSAITLAALPVHAQDSLMFKYATTITKEELSTHVHKLASDEMEGRFTGSRGLVRAQKYITGEFEQSGLQMPVISGVASYAQEFTLDECRWKDQRLTLNGTELRVGKDFLFLSDPVDISGDFPVIFSGFAIEDLRYSDFIDIDVTDKIMLAFSGEPRKPDGTSVISGKKEWSKKGYYFSKAKMAADKGAEGVFIIFRNRSDYRKYLKSRDYYDPKPVIRFPVDDGEFIQQKQPFAAYMNVKTAARLVGESPKKLFDAREEMEKTLKTRAGAFSGHVSVQASSDCYHLPTANVVGFVEGADLKSQVVVVVAHYDHLGQTTGKIFYGADDNASGTAAVLEIAEAFAMAAGNGIRPRRSVVFLAVSAEEIGLYGSKYYTMNPLFPLDSTFACVNIDMIGRASTKQVDSPDYIAASVYLSEELLKLSQEANRTAAPDLEDRVEYKRSLRGGSDHYYFSKNGIPSIFYFAGFHPDYHEATDTPDKILYDRMETITRAIFVTTWKLADREEKLENGN